MLSIGPQDPERALTVTIAQQLEAMAATRVQQAPYEIGAGPLSSMV